MNMRKAKVICKVDIFDLYFAMINVPSFVDPPFMSKNSNVHNHQLFTLRFRIDLTPYCMLWPNKVELIFKWV